MLIDFKFKNFKNFKEQADFSFIKGGKTELSYHTIKCNKYRLLPVKVIYGSNSSGKSNIFDAFRLLKKIIINQYVRKSEDDYIGLCSNFDSLQDYESPMTFNIIFSINEDIYNYELWIKNYFKNSKSEILFEQLLENDKLIFKRNGEKIQFSEDAKVINKYYPQFENKDYMETFTAVLEKNMDPVSVFTKWFSSLDLKLCRNIENFFNKILIINNVEKFRIDLPIKKEESAKTNIFKSEIVTKLLKELGVGDQELFFEVDTNGNLLENVLYKSKNMAIQARAEATESKGTLKMVDLIFPIIDAISNGNPILIDEFDSSIHHEIIYNIVQSFCNPDINKNGAQLIFSTHNPVYLNKNLLRRDEIVFVEKDNNNSSLCTLDDYNIRNDSVYLKNYLAGNYTILPSFDLENIIKKD